LQSWDATLTGGLSHASHPSRQHLLIPNSIFSDGLLKVLAWRTVQHAETALNLDDTTLRAAAAAEVTMINTHVFNRDARRAKSRISSLRADAHRDRPFVSVVGLVIPIGLFPRLLATGPAQVVATKHKRRN
jgi:hypothetical protein